MSGMELNKIVAGILIAGLVMMVGGKVSSVLYSPVEPEKRGYALDESMLASVSNTATSAAPEEALDIKPLLASASAANGEKVAKKCVACHSFDQGGPNKVGPVLWDTIGKKVAAHGGFAYSPALQEYGGTWTYDRMAAFLNKPKKEVKGTKMAFAGLRKPQDIADMIAYLRQQSSNPPALP